MFETKMSIDSTSSVMNCFNIRTNLILKETGHGAQSSKHPMLASRTRCKCSMETIPIR